MESKALWKSTARFTSFSHSDQSISLSGLASLLLIIMIGYDRYNVIVKGFSGTKITPCIALGMITFAFSYATIVCILPLLKIWGRYTLGRLNYQFCME